MTVESKNESKHYVLPDDDASAVWFLGTLAMIRADAARTGDALAVVEFTHPAGFATPRHVHHTADEAFYVLEGSMRGFCGDQEWRASRGAFVWLPRGIPHGYAVEGDEPLRTLAFAIPAGFDEFVIETGEPASTRTLPPPGAPNLERMAAAAAKAGIETLGPPEI
jgi:quercetin dioxygenase-like cupin family protein